MSTTRRVERSEKAWQVANMGVGVNVLGNAVCAASSAESMSAIRP